MIKQGVNTQIAAIWGQRQGIFASNSLAAGEVMNYPEYASFLLCIGRPMICP